MYLIDTSVWIDYFREVKKPHVYAFHSILDQKIPYGISSVIFQEILQGAATVLSFSKLVEYLSTLRIYEPEDSILSYQNAAKLYFDCRKQGITIRSTIDCLIAEIAIENNLILLHNDKDFEALSQTTPAFKQTRTLPITRGY